MKILVTGSAGFIGFHLSKFLLERGDEVFGVDNFNSYYDPKLKEDRNAILEKCDSFEVLRGDLADLNFVKSVFEGREIEAVCHLAAQAGVRYSLTHPHAYVQANLVGFTNLIDEVKNAGVKNFVYASSSSVYGNNGKVPFAVDDEVDHPISLYAASKKANELIAHVYHHLYGLKCVGLRFFTVYGPWGRPDMAAFKFLNHMMKDEPIDVYNYGKEMMRDFTYIDDIVDGVVASIDGNFGYEVFNLGNHNPVQLMDFISVLEKHADREARKNLLPMQPGDVKKTYADIDKSRELLGFQPKIEIEEGLKKFVDWYKDYYNIAN